MRLELKIEPSDVDRVKALVRAHDHHRIVEERKSPPARLPSRRLLWRAHLLCLLTTQNKSGEGSAVEAFLKQRPFPLRLDLCIAQEAGVERYIYSTFENTDRRMRRWKIVSVAAAANLKALNDGEWEILSRWANILWQLRKSPAHPNDYELEREAAQYLQSCLEGFGPKQSRNFWQSLMLTRFEIPIDSRVLRWCRQQLGLILPVAGLSNEEFYCQIMDALRELCRQAGVWPSIFDAAVFSSFERGSELLSTTAVLDDED